jgi:hypothetical protein
MIITISKIAERTKTSKAGKKYKVVEVTGNKWHTEEEWTTGIFKNMTDLLEMLEEFGPGDVANFKFDTSGKWPELMDIEEPTEEDLKHAVEQAENSDSYKPKGGSGGGRKSTGGASSKSTSSSMSKEEWAAKDQATKESIARAVAVKLAMDNTKVGATPTSIIKMAVKFLPFLMGEDEILFDRVTDPEDALDPPTD